MSSISATGAAGGNTMMMQGMGGRRRPDPAEMADKLFSKIDTDNQGYIEQSDLESALGQVDEGSNAADLFAKLDGDGDGKVTKDEFSTALKAVAEELDSQFASMRMQGGKPPPPPADDAGFTKDELTSQLDEIGSSDSQRSSLISNIVDNFDAADSDGDGKVSFQEAMAYDESNGGSSSGKTSDASTGESSEMQLMRQIMRLAEAYGLAGGNHEESATLSTSA